MSERKVTTDALETLGTIHEGPQHRDAIHLAVEPVEAGERLQAGEHITVENGVAFWAENGQGLGIVDPFLTIAVKKGQRFWFVMYPRQVHSLRHVWTHPAFGDDTAAAVPASPIETSETWIAQLAASIELTPARLMDAAREWAEYDDYTRDDSERYKNVPDEEWAKFWGHWAIVTGNPAPANADCPFTCSC